MSPGPLAGIQVVELGGATEAVGVDVDELRAPHERGVDARDDEGRGGHRAPHPEPFAEATGQGRLAGAQAPGEHDEVAGPQQVGQSATGGDGRVRVGQQQTHAVRSVAGSAVPSLTAALARSASRSAW